MSDDSSGNGEVSEIPKAPEPILLKYNSLSDYSNIKNIILIDNQVTNHNDFYTNCNESTFPIVYDYTSTSTELNTVLANFTSINRIGLVFDELHLNGKVFIDKLPFFNDANLTETNVDNLSGNFKLVVDICNKLGVINVDFLTCNSLNYDDWVKYYGLLNTLTKTDTNLTGVIVGASNDKTGNIKYGGDWVMESTGSDIELTYFTSGISGYAGTLNNNPITANTRIDIRQDVVSGKLYYKSDNGTESEITVFPIQISNTNNTNTMMTVYLNTNIKVSTANTFFICSTRYITFEGNNNTITINGVTNYNGFIQNGYDYQGQSNVTVQNIKVDGTGGTGGTVSTLAQYGGWVCQVNFGYGAINCNVNNCSSKGDITGTESGGICGAGVGRAYSISDGSCNITNCSSTGNITGLYAGGICGSLVGNGGNGGNGYIAGWGAGSAGGAGGCTITNCYSSGTIASSGGGICGSNAGAGGNGGAGGDVGAGVGAGAGGAGAVGGCTITNCYSSGTIGVSTGGICGSNAGLGGNRGNAGYGGSGFGGAGGVGGNGGCTITNCYSSKGSWSDSTATYSSTNTGGLNISGIYISIGSNTPFLLSSFNTNFYGGTTSSNSLPNIYTNLTLNNSPFTSLPLSNSFTQYFQLVPSSTNIQINSLGQLSSNTSGTYSITILRGFKQNAPNNSFVQSSGKDVIIGYNIIPFSLTTFKPFFSANSKIAKILSDGIGNLYVCGSFTLTTATSNIYNLAKYNISGNSWSSVGSYYPTGQSTNAQFLNYFADIQNSYIVRDMCFDNNKNLYICGIFGYLTSYSGGTSQIANTATVAVYKNGNWSSVSSDSTILTRLTFNQTYNKIIYDSAKNNIIISPFSWMSMTEPIDPERLHIPTPRIMILNLTSGLLTRIEYPTITIFGFLKPWGSNFLYDFITVDSNGNIYVAGYSPFNGVQYGVVAKYNSVLSAWNNISYLLIPPNNSIGNVSFPSIIATGMVYHASSNSVLITMQNTITKECKLYKYADDYNTFIGSGQLLNYYPVTSMNIYNNNVYYLGSTNNPFYSTIGSTGKEISRVSINSFTIQNQGVYAIYNNTMYYFDSNFNFISSSQGTTPSLTQISNLIQPNNISAFIEPFSVLPPPPQLTSSTLISVEPVADITAQFENFSATQESINDFKYYILSYYTLYVTSTDTSSKNCVVASISGDNIKQLFLDSSSWSTSFKWDIYTTSSLNLNYPIYVVIPDTSAYSITLSTNETYYFPLLSTNTNAYTNITITFDTDYNIPNYLLSVGYKNDIPYLNYDGKNYNIGQTILLSDSPYSQIEIYAIYDYALLLRITPPPNQLNNFI